MEKLEKWGSGSFEERKAKVLIASILALALALVL